MGYKHGTAEERFWRQVNKQSIDECWFWIAHTNTGGYGRFCVRQRYMMLAHRWSYQNQVGLIPSGLVIDHLCRNHACVNPNHLEPVTRLENVRRGTGHGHETHCPQKHPYSLDNTLHGPGNIRRCRICRREQFNRANKKRREKLKKQKDMFDKET